MGDLLYVGPEAGFEALSPAAEALGVRLYPATPQTAPGVLARYGGVLDGALVSGGTAGALVALDRVAPGLPVALLDASARAGTSEAPGEAAPEWPETVLRQALDELHAGHRHAETRGDESVERTPPGWTTHAAYRLAGVADPRDGADAERLAREAGRWHLALTDVVSRLPEGVSVRARYAGVGGEVRAGLVLTATGPSAEAARGAIGDARAHLGPLLRAGVVGGGAYVLEPSDGSLLVPVRARAALALRPPDGDDLAPLFDGSEGDPWTAHSGTALAEGERGGVGLPVVEPSGALGGLLALLAGLDVAAVVDVTVRPAPLDVGERALAEELARRAVGARRRDGYGGAKALGRRAVQLAVESERAVAVEVTVAADAATVPAVLVVETSRALVGDPASVRARPARSEVRGGLLVVEGPRGEGLEGRMGPDEAARSLRLPGPGESAPGVPATHPAQLQAPEALPEAGALVGHAPDGREVRVSAPMLTTHALVAGATGTGKSTLAMTLASELAEAGHGLLILDPHGTLASAVRDQLPASRREDLVWVDGGAQEHAHRVNLLDYDEDDPASRDRVFDDLYSFFDAWYDMKDAGGPMFELHLREALRLLLHDPTERHALPSLVRLFTDRAYRQLLVEVCANEETARFWRDAEHRSDHAKISEVGPYVYSKINRLLGSHAVRQMVSSPETTSDLDPAAWLRDGAVVLCTLPVGVMGAEGASVIGSVLLSRLVRAGFARLHGGGEARPFVAILDEAQRFAGGHEPAVLLAEGRKTAIGLVALTQRLSSLSLSFREAALANAGLVAAMRVGVADAALLGPYLAPSFRAEDLLGLGRGEAAVRLQLPDGEPGRPFLLRTRPPKGTSHRND